MNEQLPCTLVDTLFRMAFIRCSGRVRVLEPKLHPWEMETRDDHVGSLDRWHVISEYTR